MFAGFSPETIDFLWGIRMNNNRDWFLAHKDEYERYLYQPMKELGQALFEPFRDIPGLELKVSRIYRDARLHPPVPYKESLWICIRRHVESWDRNPALFFEIRPEGASCGFLLWRPATAAMESFRQALAGRPDHFPALLAKAQADSGLTLSAETYKRPKPCADPALQPYFLWKGGLEAVRDFAPGPALFDPALPQPVHRIFSAWLPVFDYLYLFTNP